MSSPKGIGTLGSIGLLVSSMTGPGLSTIPPLFQQSGWVAPVFIFVVVAFLSTCSALFVCEALSNIRGNEKFQAKVELTTIAQVYLGKKYHYVFQVFLYLALQSVNVASIILAAQTFDGMLITIFKGTCGLGVSPGGWFCETQQTTEGNSPFSSDSYFIFTFGYLLTAVMVVPLGFFSLVENIFVQITSFFLLTGILIQWIVAFIQQGLDPALLPPNGGNASMVLGIVIFNYSYITTVPSWINSLRPGVNIHRCMYISVVISTIFYITLGCVGAMAYQMSASSDILAILSSHGSTASLVTCYLFPVVALVTSIPVFTIVIRSNLLRGQICGRPMAIFLSNFVPWIICIPMQTQNWVGTLQNWSSLFFQSTVNFILPFILYFISRRYVASVEPLEEKEPSKAPESILDEKMGEEDNEVVMYNPEDNLSISIRRSSIVPSRASRMEQSIASPRLGLGSRLFNHSGLSHVFAGSPRSPRTPRFEGNIPTIVHSGIETIPQDSRIKPLSVQNSPNILKVPDSTPNSPVIRKSVDSAQNSPHILKVPESAQNTSNILKVPDSPHPSGSSYTAISTNGLGISEPGSAPNTPTGEQPQLLADDLSKSKTGDALNGDRLATNTVKQKSADKDQQGISPIISPHSHYSHQSMIASILSMRSSMVGPAESFPEKGQEGKVEFVYDDNDTERFRAFKRRPWFNPFYLAIISSAALGLSIVFMIIYDLTMLGLGNDVFG